jgi:hypothetical protein
MVAEEWVLLLVIKKRKQVRVHVQNGSLIYNNTHMLIIPWENWIEILRLGCTSCPCSKRHVFHLVTSEPI